MTNYNSLKSVREDLFSGKISCTALLGGYLKNIEQDTSNSFIETFNESAHAKALEVDAKVANVTAGKLAGMVIGIKDNICYKGHKVTASSKILEGFESIFSATVVDRLLAEETGLPVIVAEEPLTCVARGCGRALEEIDKLGNIFAYE